MAKGSAEAYQFKTKKAATPKAVFHKAKDLTVDPEAGPLLVLGQPAGSKEEWRTAQALNIMQWQYAYQYPVFGGRSRRGGQVIDFLVYTPGRYTIVDVRGSYWHTGKHNDALDIERVARRKNWILVILWDYDCKSVSEALTFLRSHLPHG
ncbi:conserved hypothetical protein [Gammaproteobacteria bacterium]